MEHGMEVRRSNLVTRSTMTYQIAQESTFFSFVCMHDLQKLTIVAMCFLKVIYLPNSGQSRERSHAEITNLISWVRLGPGRTSTLS